MRDMLEKVISELVVYSARCVCQPRAGRRAESPLAG